MTPLQTTYNGLKYRSRTEARWAVFFDAYGLDFIYEPEGYDLDGIKYLVDFWVPEWDSYIEVKNTIELSELELEKVARLTKASGKNVIIVNGTPDIHNAMMLIKGEPYDGEIMTCRRCHRMTISNRVGGYQELSVDACKQWDCGDRIPLPNERYRKAIAASRNERFGVHD